MSEALKLALEITANTAKAIQNTLDLEAGIDSLTQQVSESQAVADGLSNAWVQAAFDSANLQKEIKSAKTSLAEMAIAGIGKSHVAFQGLQSQILVNEAALVRLNKEVKSAEAAYDKAASATNSLKVRLGQASVALETQKQALGSAGIDATKLSEELARLAGAEEKAKASAVALEAGLRKAAEAEAQAAIFAERLAAGLRKGAATAAETAQIKSNLFHIEADHARQNRAFAEQAQAQQAAQQKSINATAQSYELANNSIARAVRSALGMAAATVGIYEVKNAFMSVLETGGKFESLNASLESLMGSVAAGQSAAAWIKKFGMDTPLELDAVTKAFITLKAYGFDPMDGTLRNLTAENAKLSGGQEQLIGIAKALGQAWNKLKLEAEEADQLVQQGIPVWDMMAKIMGKSTEEVMALSKAGSIGRKEIKALIDEMGRSSEGALEAQMKTWNGLISNLKDNWTQFLDSIAKAGALDYFKGQIASINAEMQALAANGELESRAKAIADAMVSIGKGLKATATAAYENREALALLAEAFLALKLVEAAGGAMLFASSLKAAGLASTTMLGTLGPAIAAVGALAFAQERVNSALDDYAKREALAKDAKQGAAEATDSLLKKLRDTIHATEQYAETAIASSEQVKTANAGQAAAYVDALTQAQKYWNAQEIAWRRAGNAEEADKASAKVRAYAAALKEAAAQVAALNANPLEDILSADDKRLDTFVEQLKAATSGTKDAKKAWADYTETLTATDLAGIAQSARQMLDFVRQATGENSKEAERWAGIVDSVLRESLNRMGIDAEQALTGVSSEVRKAVGEFDQLGKVMGAAGVSGQRAGAIIGGAFANLIGKAKTAADIDLIRQRLDATSKAAQAGTPLFFALAAAHEQLVAAQSKVVNTSLSAADALRIEAQSAEAAKNATYAQASASAERAQAEANHAAAQQQQHAKSQQQAAQRQAADAQQIHDGEQLQEMWDIGTAALLAMGEAGKKAMDALRPEVIGDDFGRYFKAVEELRVSWQQQADEVARLTENLKQATESGVGLQAAIGAAGRNFDMLDKQQLAGLQAALDAARQKMLALTDAAKAAEMASLDALYQAQGDKTASERLRYEQQIADIQARQAEAAKAGNAEAQAAYRRTLDNLRQVHEQKMGELAKEQAAAKAEAAQPAGQRPASANDARPGQPQPATSFPSPAAYSPPSSPTQTIRLELALPGGGIVPADVNASYERQLRGALRARKST